MTKNYVFVILVILVPGYAISENTEIVGQARVVDGDTLEINNQKIRIQGIDAPETAQICGIEDKPVYCGKQASYELEALIGDQEIKCLHQGLDKYKRVIGECYLGDIEINEWMVKNGWALAYRKYSIKYVEAEAYAKGRGLGLWKLEFIEPWKWRSIKKSLDRAN